jgi:hypothetical protein
LRPYQNIKRITTLPRKNKGVGNKMKKEIKKEIKTEEGKCEHTFIPIAYTCDLQVFGLSDELKEVFLEGNGFLVVECSECGKTGYCILS